MIFNNGDQVEILKGAHKGKFAVVTMAQHGQLPKDFYSYVRIFGRTDDYALYNTDLRIFDREEDYVSDF